MDLTTELTRLKQSKHDPELIKEDNIDTCSQLMWWIRIYSLQKRTTKIDLTDGRIPQALLSAESHTFIHGITLNQV